MWSRKDCAKVLLVAVVFLAVGLLLFPPAGQPATFAGPVIYVVDAAPDLPAEAVADALPAFQAAVDEDFGPAWNASATLELVDEAPAGGWTITIESYSDVYGAAGYHMTCPGDVPCGKAFVDEGLSWELVFTHELFEMLADPHIDRATYIWGKGVFYALEVGDPVEDARYAYTRPAASGEPVVISDFVTERWFNAIGGGPLDFTGNCRHALHVLTGGYMRVHKDGSWTEFDRVRGRRAAIFKAPTVRAS